MGASLNLNFYEFLEVKDVFRDAFVGVGIEEIVVVAIFPDGHPVPIAKAHYFLQGVPLDPSVDQIPHSLRIIVLRLSANVQFSSSQPSALHPRTPQHFDKHVNVVISAIVPVILLRLFLEASAYLFERLGVNFLSANEVVYRAFAVAGE